MTPVPHYEPESERFQMITPYGEEWIRSNFPGWLIIDSDDGMTVEGGTSYLLERWLEPSAPVHREEGKGG